MPSAYISLGSNLGDRAAQLRQAIVELAQAGRVTAVSSFYETEPVEFADQPWFLNCAVAMQTELTPRTLLDEFLKIEQRMGRVRSTPKGPRTLDLDILLFGDVLVDEPGLTIPHPAMHVRRFVLEPLVEIAPDLRHPALGKTIRDLFAALPPGPEVRRVEPDARV